MIKRAEARVIEYKSTEYTIEYNVSGDYYPATYYTPAEYPEIELKALYNCNGTDIVSILTDKQYNGIVDDILEEVCNR